MPSAPRRGAIGGATGGGRTVSIRWDTHELNGATIMKYDLATINRCKLRMKELAREMKSEAQKNPPWTSHKERHPSRAWPNPRTAAELLFAYVRGTRVITLTFTHSPGTIWVRKRDGASFNYGIRLETWHGGRFAVIQPTIRKYAPLMSRVMSHTFNNVQGPVPDDAGVLMI